MRAKPSSPALLRAAALLCAPLFLAPEALAAQVAEGPAARESSPAPGAATPADYRSRVGRAARQLEELANFCDELARGEKYENWSSGKFEPDLPLQLPAREENAAAALRRLLPPTEPVVAGAGVVVVADNRWLREALAAYETASAKLDNAGRSDTLRVLAGRLRSLEKALAEPDAGGAPPRDKDAEKGRLAAILRRPGFDRETARGGALRRLMGEIAEWVRGLFPEIEPLRPGTSGRVSQGAQYFVFGLCLLVLAYVGWRLWSRRTQGAKKEPRRGPRVVLGERLEEDETAADLLEEAERLARAGDTRAAIRKAYVALLVELGDRGLLRLARHNTNRDYLEQVRESSPPRLYAEVLPLTLDYESHWYGLRDADEADWGRFRERCRQALGAARTRDR